MIDQRLEDCSSELEIAENFNRVLALVDANSEEAGTNTDSIASIVASLPTRTITFNSDGGSDVDAQTVYYGGVAVEPDNPTKAEATFAGWNLSESAYDFSAAVTTDITLVAQWT